jgi:hypothetical protein
MLVACGKVQATDVDAPLPPIDAAIDAPPAPVKVTVLTYLGDGAPDTTVTVVFQDPAGNLVFDGPVDAMGKISAMLPEGGTVTSIHTNTDTATNLAAALTSITGVKPGDDITIGVKANATIRTQGGQTTMSATFTPVSGAGIHQFFTECGVAATNTSPVTLTFRDSCHGNTFDLLVVASGGLLTTPEFIKVVNINHVNNGSFTIPNGYSLMQNFTANLSNVANEVSGLTLTRASMFDSAAIGAQSVALGDPPAGTFSGSVPFPPNVGTRSEVSLAIMRSDATVSQLHQVHTATLANNVAIDLNANALPFLSNVAITPTGLNYTTVVDGVAPDGMLILWSGGWTNAGVQTAIGWRVAQRVNATSGVLVHLPTKYARYDPSQQTASITTGTGFLAMVDYDVIDGYDEFRQQPDTLVVSSPSDMGALVGMPFQRRYMQTSVR